MSLPKDLVLDPTNSNKRYAILKKKICKVHKNCVFQTPPGVPQHRFSIGRMSQQGSLSSAEGRFTPSSSMPDLAQRFTNLSVGCEPLARNSGPVFSGPMMPAMSHTYINQYTGSDFNLDKQLVSQLSIEK